MSELKASATKQTFMVGTEGNPDYLVVAKDHNVALGIKPLLSVMHNPDHTVSGMFIGLRVRKASAFADGDVVSLMVDNVTQLPIKKSLNDAFPGLNWVKKDTKRWSTVIGFHVPRAPWQIDEVKKYLQEARVFWKLITMVSQGVEDNLFTGTPDDAHGWLTSVFGEKLDVFAEQVKALEANMDTDAEPAYIDDLMHKILHPTAKDKGVSKGLKIVPLAGSIPDTDDPEDEDYPEDENDFADEEDEEAVE